jgi:hypothetical protein
MLQDHSKAISKTGTHSNPIVDTELDRTLREAIRTKHLLRFRYKDQDRIAEPHDYGIQKGIVRLLCYQVGGESRNRLPGWRWIDVLEMRDCKILEQRFAGGRNVPSGQHHQWDEIFIAVAPAKSPKPDSSNPQKN